MQTILNVIVHDIRNHEESEEYLLPDRRHIIVHTNNGGEVAYELMRLTPHAASWPIGDDWEHVGYGASVEDLVRAYGERE